MSESARFLRVWMSSTSVLKYGSWVYDTRSEPLWEII